MAKERDPKDHAEAALVKAVRHALGLTQGELGMILAVDQRTVRNWEAAVYRVPGPAWVALNFLLDHHKKAWRDACPEKVSQHAALGTQIAEILVTRNFGPSAVADLL